MLALLIHPVLALAIQALSAWLLNDWVAGALIACAVFGTREQTQAEYRWIERFGKPFQTPADYAEWHYKTYGEAEGRELPGSWEAYYALYPDLQAEYARLSGLRANMPWWGGFDPRVWSRDAALDLILPIAATTVAAFIFA